MASERVTAVVRVARRVRVPLAYAILTVTVLATVGAGVYAAATVPGLRRNLPWFVGGLTAWLAITWSVGVVLNE